MAAVERYSRIVYEVCIYFYFYNIYTYFYKYIFVSYEIEIGSIILPCILYLNLVLIK